MFGRMFGLSLLATLAALVVAGLAIGGVLERFVTGGIDARLGDRLIALESAIRPDGSLDRDQLVRVTARIPPDEPWRIEVTGVGLGGGGDLGPALAMKPGRGPPITIAPPPRRPADRGGDPFDRSLPNGTRVHGLSKTVATGTGAARVAVAVERGQIERPVLAALAPLTASLAILGLALGGAALVQLRIGLRPLTALRIALEDIRHGRATQAPTDVPDELAPLARELNALATDTEAALTGARASAANLAHALKTPVATLSLHLRDDPAARAQIERIEATLRHHLGRARADATDRRAVTLLAPALGDLADTIRALHGGRVRLDVDVPDGLAAAIDPHDLNELVGNLIDNAARHAASAVIVAAVANERRVVLTIVDDGPGIAPADRDRATIPGIRLDERAHGHGFGLAIARELAELYGGGLALGDAAGGGLIATVTLPVAA